MSAGLTDVGVYFRSGLELRDVVLITQKVLQELPCRILPEFNPWFPSTSDSNKAIRPKHPPPVISSKDLQDIICCTEKHQSTSDTRNQNKPENICSTKSLCSPEKTYCDKGQFEDKPKEVTRSWCVITHRKSLVRSTHSFSQPFRKAIEKHKLHLHQRVKWVVCERNCVTHSVEEVWRQLNRAIRHCKLPTCNANFQRELPQIWVFCDVFYCEFIGDFLKHEFRLSGKITLTVHKLGDIFQF